PCRREQPAAARHQPTCPDPHQPPLFIARPRTEAATASTIGQQTSGSVGDGEADPRRSDSLVGKNRLHHLRRQLSIGRGRK
ncbi:hypothetical protein Dimus_018037, partial [Dionaea muscipula]